MLLNQSRNPLNLPLAQIAGLLALGSLILTIGLALELLNNHRRLGGVDIDLVIGKAVQRVIERVRGIALTSRNFNLLLIMDHTKDLAGLGVALNSGLTQFELLGGVAAAGDLKRVFGNFSLDGEALFTTCRGVELVQQTEALVVLGQSLISIPIERSLLARSQLFFFLEASRIPVISDDLVAQNVNLFVTALEAVVLGPGLGKAGSVLLLLQEFAHCCVY